MVAGSFLNQGILGSGASELSTSGLFFIEGVIMISFFYLINRLILRYDYKVVSQKSIALKTAAINFLIIVGILIWGAINN